MFPKRTNVRISLEVMKSLVNIGGNCSPAKQDRDNCSEAEGPYWHTYVHRTFQSRPLRLSWISKPDVIFHWFGRQNVFSSGRLNWYSVLLVGLYTNRWCPFSIHFLLLKRTLKNWTYICIQCRCKPILIGPRYATTKQPFDIRTWTNIKRIKINSA